MDSRYGGSTSRVLEVTIEPQIRAVVPIMYRAMDALQKKGYRTRINVKRRQPKNNIEVDQIYLRMTLIR
ncbi:MAG: hypothetical protein ACW979_09050 [Candidatus Thorarchaeota archaeon]|jgi:hypothetical protein